MHPVVRNALPATAILVMFTWPAFAETVTSPQQLRFGDTYRLVPDAASGDDASTCPKFDANDGQNGDNPYFRRFNVMRAHLGVCSQWYWYTAADQLLCTSEPPANTCDGSECVDEPDPASAQYVDYAPPFGSAAQELPPGRYLLSAEYRYAPHRADYPAQYTIFNANGTDLVLWRQDQASTFECTSFDLGTFDMTTGSFVRVEDTGAGSITFNRLTFTWLGPLGGVPYVSAGPDQALVLPAKAHLLGKVADDGAPAPLVVTWSVSSGPSDVLFADEHAADTLASFSAPGTYNLTLTVTDGLNLVHDDLLVIVHPQGTRYRYTSQYEFDSDTPDPSTPGGVLDADPGDINGDGRLTKTGTGYGNLGGGIANGILHFVDNTSSGNHGYSWNNGGVSLSLTVDMRAKANATTAGTLERRAMGFSGGVGINRGMRINQPGSATCPLGSVIFSATDGSKGPEGCVDLNSFHRIRVTVNAATGLFRVFDLDNQVELTSTTGGGSGPASQIIDKGGFQIGSIAGSTTTKTDFELDYFRVLLGTAVEDAVTPIANLSCGELFADADRDGDVDQADFGLFQACYSGSSVLLDLSNPSNCGCFDRNGDHTVDVLDLDEFLACITGPGMNWHQAMPPNCLP